MAGTASHPYAQGVRVHRGTRWRIGLVGGAALLAGIIVWAIVQPAYAGQASSGELLFYPCADCHPVVSGEPVKPLPYDFEGHKITLEGHDKLAAGEAACLVCHDDPSTDPGMLKMADGSRIDLTTDVPRFCYQCHSARYKEWAAGTHGRGLPSCTSAGCHDPHTPAYIYAGPLLPFTGAGFQFKALSGREPFTPLAPPAPAPGTITPPWYAALVMLGLAAAAGLVLRLLRGRQTR